MKKTKPKIKRVIKELKEFAKQPKPKPLARYKYDSKYRKHDVWIGKVFVVWFHTKTGATRRVSEINRAAEAWAKARGK